MEKSRSTAKSTQSSLMSGGERRSQHAWSKAGYGQVLTYCPKMGYCSTKCSKMEKWARSSDCKGHCCLPDNWKWK
ncbi:UNVERIFIED_CONTAM: hypothetical protein H355_010086 [Colinus virginianus]|nr:hypothetical protein H355_010086 [Colinus virginianus]